VIKRCHSQTVCLVEKVFYSSAYQYTVVSAAGAVELRMVKLVLVMFSTQTSPTFAVGVASTFEGAASRPWLTVALVLPAGIVAALVALAPGAQVDHPALR
jgi:hypothetical protein